MNRDLDTFVLLDVCLCFREVIMLRGPETDGLQN